MSELMISDSVAHFVPYWLANRKDRNVGYKILYAIALVLDSMVEFSLQGIYARFPGKGTTTALPYTGRSRGIIRGEAETDASYEARLRAWLDIWPNAGSDEVLARAIQSYLANSPRVRIVDRSGHWTTLESDGTVTRTNAAWDWDSISNPERSDPLYPWWSDIWIIIYPCEWPITGSALASLVGVWGTSELGTGHAVQRAAVDAITALCAQWKGTHCWLQAIIWSYDSSLFNPSSPGSLPDGRWGQWHKWAPGSGSVPARGGAADGTVRYWIPAEG